MAVYRPNDHKLKYQHLPLQDPPKINPNRDFSFDYMPSGTHGVHTYVWGGIVVVPWTVKLSKKERFEEEAAVKASGDGKKITATVFTKVRLAEHGDRIG
jgi:hypothetical protein